MCLYMFLHKDNFRFSWVKAQSEVTKSCVFTFFQKMKNYSLKHHPIAFSQNIKRSIPAFPLPEANTINLPMVKHV